VVWPGLSAQEGEDSLSSTNPSEDGNRSGRPECLSCCHPLTTAERLRGDLCAACEREFYGPFADDDDYPRAA